MKKLIIINGVPGIGKTTTCSELLKKLRRSAWLDGDWCWVMNPFVANEQNKRMAHENIVFVLRSYLKNPSFDYVIFSWGIRDESYFPVLLGRLKGLKFQLIKISLVCSAGALQNRMARDRRSLQQIQSSVRNLSRYYKMNTIKVDSTNLNITQTVEQIIKAVRGNRNRR